MPEEMPEGMPEDKAAAGLMMLMYEMEMALVMETIDPVIETLRGKVHPAAVILALFQVATNFIEANKGREVSDEFAKTCAKALLDAVKKPTV